MRIIDFSVEGLRSFKEVRTIFPSPRRVVCAMVNRIDWSRVKSVAELGAGNGAVTRSLLEVMPRAARLTVYETNPKYCRDLDELADSRMTIKNEGAENLDFPVDLVVSSVPMACFSIRDGRSRILDTVVEHLSPKGQFVHHQYKPGMGKVLNNYFADVQRRLVLCYFWPAPVYNCREPR